MGQIGISEPRTAAALRGRPGRATDHSSRLGFGATCLQWCLTTGMTSASSTAAATTSIEAASADFVLQASDGSFGTVPWLRGSLLAADARRVLVEGYVRAFSVDIFLFRSASHRMAPACRVP